MQTIRARLWQLALAVILVFFSLAIGIVGLMWFEDLHFWQAFYLSVILVSTVGMNEVGPISDAGKIFIAFYIIFNLSIFAYFISVITRYLFEGELREIFKSYMVSKVTDRMKDHVIVCGYGKNGKKACEELHRSHVAFVLIEQDQHVVDDTFANAANVVLLQGDATSDDVLITAGIKRARTIITTLPKDADNVFVTLTARELNPQINIISRASEESSISKLKRAGAHHVVMPDAIGGLQMANLVTRPEVVEFLGLLNGIGSTNLKLDEIRYEEMRDDLRGKSLRKMRLRELTGVNILGIKTKEKKFIFNPHPDTILQSQEVAIVLGTEQELDVFMKHCHKRFSML